MINAVYIHIPFCEHLCTYCDFCKQYYNEELANKYLDSLQKEIKDKYRGDKIKTLYIGGGTPSCLNVKYLQKLFNIIQIFTFDSNYEFTIEVNPENIDKEKLLLMKKYGVNRLSMGIESTNDNFLKYLGRKHSFKMAEEKISLIKSIGIDNINVDLIYAIPNETINDLKKDLDNILSLDVNHISTYSLMINDNTVLGINKEKNIPDDFDSDMYNFIKDYLIKNGFNHYEISNFAKTGYESQHNLVYWHNEKYYGFGLGASGYIDDYRYDNTRSMHKYLNGNYLLNKENISLKDEISYELILGFRLVNGINKETFYQKYHCQLIDMYNIKELIAKKFLIDDGSNIKISYDKIYIENSILVNFV